MLLLTELWPGLVGATALGLAVGWLAGWPARPGAPLVLASLCAGLAALALSGLVPGVGGLWVDSACALALPYAAACALAGLVRRLLARA